MKPTVAASILTLAMATNALPACAAAPQPIAVRIDATRRAAPVTRYEYGMFIEPIGGLVARTLWAEMLDDRKFYDPIGPASADTPPPPSAEGRPGMTYRKWRPIGGDAVVTMEARDPYVGTQSPRVGVAGETGRGFGQSGIGVARGKRYTGYLWLSGDSGAAVKVALIWGDRAQDRQIVSLPASMAGWQQADFEFTPTADSKDARFEITGTGTGSFRIGAVSLMPADNIHGWRADTPLSRGRSIRASGGCRAATSCPIGIGMARSGRATGVRRCSITPGARCRPTISAWTSGWT